ncbi:hypothetical protein HBB16_15805 [Pseudonocardia sp. MCCB 268]|nr:hypothetical protein [Pseudonocardia cytotoxica]
MEDAAGSAALNLSTCCSPGSARACSATPGSPGSKAVPAQPGEVQDGMMAGLQARSMRQLKLADLDTSSAPGSLGTSPGAPSASRPRASTRGVADGSITVHRDTVIGSLGARDGCRSRCWRTARRSPADVVVAGTGFSAQCRSCRPRSATGSSTSTRATSSCTGRSTRTRCRT